MKCRTCVMDKDTGMCVNYLEATEPGDVGSCVMEDRYLCHEDLGHILPSISHSSSMTFIRCRQAWKFYKVDGITVRDNKASLPVKLGSIWGMFQMSRYNKGVILEVKNTSDFDREFVGQKLRDCIFDICVKYELSEFDAHKIFNLCKASIKIGIKPDLEGAEVEREFNIIHNSCVLRGYMDVAYPTALKEIKLSGSPDFYTKIHNITHQVGTYFLSDENLEHCTIEVTKVPQLRVGKATMKKDGESPEGYGKRIYDHILSKPSEYFIGYNREEKTFGKRYYRNEFPLDQLRKDYTRILVDIQRACVENSFYQSWLCHMPGLCNYHPICTTGVMSDELFQIKEKPVENESKKDNSWQ